MRRVAPNGHEQNVSVITALHAVTLFSGVHKSAEHARDRLLTTWMDLCEGSFGFLIYPPDSRSETMLLADLPVIPIKLDRARPVMSG